MRHADKEIGEILRKLHFDGHCHRWKSDIGENLSGVLVVADGYRPRSAIPYPRLDDIMYWIRDKFRICIELIYNHTLDGWYTYSFSIDVYNYLKTANFLIKTDSLMYTEHDYDTALEKEIKRILKIIQDNPNLFQNASNNH